MVDFKFSFKDNKLCTRDDVFELFLAMSEPLKNFYSEKCAFLKLDNFGAHYDEKSSYVEGFARVIWGLAPFIAGGGTSDLLNTYVQGIENGTDPESEEYWGELRDVDQKLVEMASLAVFLLLAPDKAWEPLSDKTKENFAKYLSRINEVVVPRTNWLFFRILVNVALKKTGNRYDAEKLNDDLNGVDEYYFSNGFYRDGVRGQVDYYNPFAIHFYSLIYAKFMSDEDTERCQRFKQRSSEFAKQFICWFDDNGGAVPYGRSMTYRFAMSAFFSALAFCNVEALPWGTIKAVLLKNMRWWLQKPIFARDGILTVGYAYPNLIMSEEYNSPTSPYWAFKWFLILALDKEHPFWTAEESDVLTTQKISVQKEKNFLIQRIEDGKHVVAFCSGQHIPEGFANFTAKYSKFAYSSKYGFSVSRDWETLRGGAFDSMLALRAEGETLFHVREQNEIKEINEGYILSTWSPYPDVQIETYLIPCSEFHIRVHRINSNRKLYVAEGGFSIRNWEDESDKYVECDAGKALVQTKEDVSAIVNLQGYLKGKTVASVNANLHFPRTVLPMLEAGLPEGETILACAVYAGSTNKDKNILTEEFYHECREVFQWIGTKIGTN